jgi:hypothetical protein
MQKHFSLLATLTTMAATLLETGATPAMARLWALCSSTLGRKDGMTAAGVSATLADDDSAHALVTELSADVGSNTSRGAMIFRSGAAVGYQLCLHYAVNIPATAKALLESHGATVEYSSVTVDSDGGLIPRTLYSALCQLDALGCQMLRAECVWYAQDLGYSGIRNLAINTACEASALATLGIVSSVSQDSAIALYNAKDREQHRGPVTTDYALGWDAGTAGDAFTLVRLGIAMVGRGEFAKAGAVNPRDRAGDTGAFLRWARVFRNDTVRGDGSICQHAFQRAHDRVTGKAYRARSL